MNYFVAGNFSGPHGISAPIRTYVVCNNGPKGCDESLYLIYLGVALYCKNLKDAL